MELRRKPEDQPPEEKIEPCARCGNPSECEIWETKVCYPCADDWHARSPTYADIFAKYGQDADTAASYRKFTQGWLAAFQQHKAAS